MERLCPAGDEWDAIGDDEQDVYRYCIDELLRNVDLIDVAIGRNAGDGRTNNDDVNWHPQVRK